MANRSDERKEFLSDIITTAVEGGINYWARVLEYKFGFVGLSSGDGSAYARILDAEGEEHIVTLDKIASALNKIVKNEVPGLASDYVKMIAGANFTNDAGDLDAELCDVIFQVAIFGDVIYG